MLKRLEIRDFAIINRLNLEFGPGLNVFTGETGAGKSIIVEAIGFLLGERASSEMVRSGAGQAEVCGVFSPGPAAGRLAALHGFKGGEFTVRRQLDTGGKTKGFFEGRPVAASFLSGLGDVLVDFHGQNEHQSLMKQDVQLELLDRFGRLEKKVSAYSASFERRRRLLERRTAGALSEDERARLIDLYRFQLKEIESAGLKEGEEEELQALYPRLKNAHKLSSLSNLAHESLSAGECPAVTGVERALKALEGLAELDATAAGMKDSLAQSLLVLKDVEESLYRYSRGLDTDPSGLDACLSRLDRISALKKKYGPDVPAVLRKADELRESLNGLDNAAFDMRELDAELEAAERELAKLGAALHEARSAAGRKLSGAVAEELASLGFHASPGRGGGARFSVAVETEEGRFFASGTDTIEFMFSANPGHPMKPLKLTASGGEMSRVMLALKTVLAGGDDIPVLVFDEVDTGVGSTVARLLGKRLSALASARQIFCITHMPQIAAFASAHYFVEKSAPGGISAIKVARLDEGAAVMEIARLLGGRSRSTELGLRHARELIRESREGAV